MGSAGPMTRDRFLAELLPRLAELGFVKRAGAVLTTKLSDGVIGWLSIQTTIDRDAVVAVDPTIGLRHQGLEGEVARLRGSPSHRYNPPSVSQLLGYLSGPHSPARLLDTADSIGPSVKSVTDEVSTSGRRYLAAHASLAGIVAELSSGKAPGVDHIAVRLPVGLRLLGRDPDAARYVADRLAAIGDRSDAAALRYRRFAAAFTDEHPPERRAEVSR